MLAHVLGIFVRRAPRGFFLYSASAVRSWRWAPACRMAALCTTGDPLVKHADCVARGQTEELKNGFSIAFQFRLDASRIMSVFVMVHLRSDCIPDRIRSQPTLDFVRGRLLAWLAASSADTSQGAAVYSDRQVIMEPEWGESGAINRALKIIGVSRVLLGDRSFGPRPRRVSFETTTSSTRR